MILGRREHITMRRSYRQPWLNAGTMV